LTFLRKIDYKLNSLIREQRDVLLYATIVIMILCIIIVAILVAMAIMIKNHSGLEKQSVIKKVTCLVLVGMQTFLNMPMFDVVVRTLIATQNANDI
jgi:hypothetical protein